MLNLNKIAFVAMLLCLIATLLTPSMANAIEPTPDVTPEDNVEEPTTPQGLVSRLPIMVDCGPPAMLMPDVVQKYSEVPFASMDVNFRTPSGQVLSGKGTITVNQKTKSWTYIVSFGEADNVCFFLSGQNFGPAPSLSGATVDNTDDVPALKKYKVKN